MRLALPILAAILIGIASLTAQQHTRSERATIHVEALLPFGGAAKSSEFYLTNEEQPDKTYTMFGQAVDFDDVPYGKYRLRVKNGEHSAERLVTVSTPELWCRVGVPVLRMADSTSFGGDSVVRGRISWQGVIPSDMWLRIEGLYIDYRAEMPIESSGTFRFAGLDMGTYVLQVFSAQTLLYSRVLDVGTAKDSIVTVVLPAR
jgi:hypothetical protein